MVTIVVYSAGTTGRPLLGAYTLEGLSLAVDPVEQKLVPTHLIMVPGEYVNRRIGGSV